MVDYSIEHMAKKKGRQGHCNIIFVQQVMKKVHTLYMRKLVSSLIHSYSQNLLLIEFTVI